MKIAIVVGIVLIAGLLLAKKFCPCCRKTDKTDKACKTDKGDKKD